MLGFRCRRQLSCFGLALECTYMAHNVMSIWKTLRIWCRQPDNLSIAITHNITPFIKPCHVYSRSQHNQACVVCQKKIFFMISFAYSCRFFVKAFRDHLSILLLSICKTRQRRLSCCFFFADVMSIRKHLVTQTICHT